MTFRAGNGLKDMEMIQFHPTGLGRTGILMSEAVRGEGGYLLNSEGERFMKNMRQIKWNWHPVTL